MEQGNPPPLLALAPPLSSSELEEKLDAMPRLPTAHRRLLETGDGFCDGKCGVRLLGAKNGSDESLSLQLWNDPDTWKHAWKWQEDRFFCFGMTALGDQLAYERNPGAFKDSVWLLDAFEMQPRHLGSFEDVLNLAHEGREPLYESLLNLALETRLPISWREIWVATPPAQFGTEGLVNRLRALPASLGMTFLGDAFQEDLRCGGKNIQSFVSYLDKEGRARLRFECV